MFSAFGSMINDDLETGLIETFSSNNYSDSTNNCYVDGTKIMCKSNNGSSRNNTTTQVQDDPEEEQGSNNTPTQDSSPQPTKSRVIRKFPDDPNPSVTEQFQNRTQQSQEESSESSSSDSDSDPELDAADNEDAKQRESEGKNSSVNDMNRRERPQTTPASAVVDDPDVTSGSVLDESDESDESGESGDEDSTESTGPAITEQFSNMKSVAQKATSSNIILKGVLFSCVFYILVYDETRKKVMKELTKSMKFLKSEHYEYISVLIFFVLYYIISIFL